MFKIQLATVVVVLFIMLISMSHQDPIQPVKFDMVAINQRNGFGTIATKLKSRLEIMGNGLDKFFAAFANAPVDTGDDSLLFIIRDDLGEVLTNFANDMDAFEQQFTKKSAKQAAQAVKRVGQLLRQLAGEIGVIITPLVVGQTRNGKPLVNQNLGLFTQRLASSAGQMLTTEESPKWVSTVLVDVFETLAQASSQSIQSNLDRIKAQSKQTGGQLSKQYQTVQLVGHKLDKQLKKIVDICKNVENQ
ncbi:uncharacterized protein LOC128953187 isoform X2 [Oppia nitens]|uniref:uncharacterized protein LOC128953187 isoform X2 n=1 Tax=Oppia nitens TaxID=1686743 RepID=UPI0023DBC9F9|nr:uncharacterized protein LOC128953187 isoform X2 [Oppia nitens]